MKRILIIGGLFILIVAIAIFFSTRTPKKPTGPTPTGAPTQSAPRQISFHDVIPGTATKQDVVKELGPPLREDIDAKKTTTLIYPSGQGTRALAVDIEPQGTVGRIIEPLAETTALSPLTQNLPAPTLTLYGPHFQSGYELRVYLENGVALLTNPIRGVARERWFFPPTTADIFIDTYGLGYSATPPAKDQQ